MSPKELVTRNAKGGDSSRRSQPLWSLGPIVDLESNSMTFRGARLVWNSPGLADFQPVFSLGESNQCSGE
jgi:hypothetical protein